ncbi:MAG TPA: NAD(P)H-dependent glycerol-3-phosphate dehydrogenase [Stellaceae bacterium]|nr:NAD(P)H-dependent glycerol-3-phosphate dehydrogenase [Stellaceae bacterium]
MERIGIVGAGAWGTALALALSRAGQRALIWAHEPETVEAINRRHENPLFLPGIALDPALEATGDLARTAACGIVLLATPAQHLRATATALAPALDAATPLVICAKGIEEGTGALMSEVVAASLPRNAIAVLSGPTFAGEVARGLPTAITLAAPDAALGRRLAQSIGSKTFRPYVSDDVPGAQVGGAIKNVVAIACGIVVGRKLGDNARAALITRGLAEMVRLALAKGGRAETLMGLSGLGDLTLTANGLQSRNHSLGVALGQGESLQAILAARRSVAEGVSSARAAAALASRLQVEMPIVAAVDAILHRGAPIDTVIEELLSRPLRAETAITP